MAKKINLKDKLQSLTLLHLMFTGISTQRDKDGKFIAILELAEPIARVRGSQEATIDGKTWPINATDVVEVKVHENEINEDFQFDEDSPTGEYKGSDLMLDVDKKGVVWMKRVGFAQSGRDYGRAQANENLRKLLKIPAATDNTTPPAGDGGKTSKVQPVDTKTGAKVN